MSKPRQQPSAQKWEYQAIEIDALKKSGELLKDVLNNFGKHGWELVWRSGYSFIFKRPK